MPALRSAVPAASLLLTLLCTAASAQGYQLQQHEPAAAGDGFFSVRAPKYDPTRSLAVALTLNYGHHPLLGGHVDSEGRFVVDRVVLSDQLTGHLDVSGVLFGRLQLAASLPVTLMERGAGGYGVSPARRAVVGDPRLGARVRLLGEDAGALGVHVGGDLWIPVGAADAHAGDTGLRGLLGVVVSGQVASRVEWALNAGVLFRRHASLNLTPVGHGTTGSALQGALGAAYVAEDERFRVGPELAFSTGVGRDALTSASTRLELLVGGGYRIGDVVEIGPAVGFGLLRTAGTPDVRGLLRITVLPFGGSRHSEGASPASDAQTPEDTSRADEDAADDEASRGPGREHPPAQAERPEEGTQELTQPDPVDEAMEASEPDAPPPPLEETGPVSPAPGETIVVLHFASDSAELTDAAIEQLDEALRQYEAPSRLKLSIEGHGDNRGPARWNEVLSTSRATSVRSALEARGFDRSNLSVRGYSAERPVATNDTAAGRARNRRVEVRIAE